MQGDGFQGAMRQLAGEGIRRSYRRGEALFTEGDLSDRVVLVEEGWVKISAATPDGHEVVLGIRGPGQVLGELSVIDGSPRSASAVALEHVEAAIVPASDFARALDNAALAREMLVALSERLRDADRLRVEFGSLDTLARVSRRLIELADGFGEPGVEGGVVVALPLSQEELASWCGASREATAKALRTLRDVDCISTGRRTVTVHDDGALRRHAQLSRLAT